MRSLSAKSVTWFSILALIGAMLPPVFVLLQYRSRFDASLWLTTAILVAVIMGVSVPLARWLHRNPGWFLRAPWPTPKATHDAVRKRPRGPARFLRGDFVWTAEEFARMRNAWLRHTPAGRNHRRIVYFLSAIAFTGVVAASIWLAQGQLIALILLLASAALLALVFSARIRELDEARSRARVSWQLVPDGILFQTGNDKKELTWASLYAILRTRDGFLIWPGNLHETWLPLSAFDSPKDVEVFSEIARSQVDNYVDEN